MFKFPYPPWDTLAWCVVIAAAVILETLGLTRPHDATLSALIRATIPIWARAMVLGWLAYHFLLQS